jgi:hypothetical protein
MYNTHVCHCYMPPQIIFGRDIIIMKKACKIYVVIVLDWLTFYGLNHVRGDFQGFWGNKSQF